MVWIQAAVVFVLTDLLMDRVLAVNLALSMSSSPMFKVLPWFPES
jgi:hypothetical protein